MAPTLRAFPCSAPERSCTSYPHSCPYRDRPLWHRHMARVPGPPGRSAHALAGGPHTLPHCSPARAENGRTARRSHVPAAHAPYLAGDPWDSAAQSSGRARRCAGGSLAGQARSTKPQSFQAMVKCLLGSTCVVQTPRTERNAQGDVACVCCRLEIKLHLLHRRSGSKVSYQHNLLLAGGLMEEAAIGEGS